MDFAPSSGCPKLPNLEMARRWCLYLPGVCLHVAAGADEAESLHHQSRGVDIKYDSAFDLNPAPVELHPALAISSNPESQNFTITPTVKSPSPARLTSNNQAFENTSTSVAASQMRNALNNLADTVKDPEEKKVYFEYLFAE